MAKKEKQLAKEKPEQDLAMLNSDLEYKGNEDADTSDILIPRILLMQGTSKWVPDQFQMGDLINSVEETLLAKKGETLTIIPFSMKKTWEIFTDDKTAEWVDSKKWDATNDHLEWHFRGEKPRQPEAGIFDLKRQKQYTFFCMVVGENGIGEYDLPATISFRSSAGKDGKKIASHFGVMRARNLPGFTVTWDITTDTVKSDDKSFMKYSIKRGRNVTAEESEPIKQWLKVMQTKNVVEHKEESVAEDAPVKVGVLNISKAQSDHAPLDAEARY